MRIAIPLALIGFVAPTFAQHAPAGRGDPSAPPAIAALERLTVWTPTGLVDLRVADPHAHTSAAWGISRTRSKDAIAVGAERFEPGYELTSRVVVRAPSRDAVAAAVGGRPVASLDGLAGWWVVQTGSVAQAAVLAAELAQAGRPIERAAVDMRMPISLRGLPNDPRLPAQWHLHNLALPIADVNAQPAWDLGLTGAGVTIGVVDTGIDTDHVDLAANFSQAASRPSGAAPGLHGTAVAGIAAALGNNQEYGCGLAYQARFSSQVLGTMAENAAGLAWRNDLNDIKNNSWGPLDNGAAWDPDPLVIDAIEQGIRHGRGGRGEIFVWAAGNGALNGDRVDYDPYASSRYTIAVGAVGDLDEHPAYSEPGASLMLVAPSSGNNRSIYTTAPDDGETFSFGMTSAAAPVASGAVALLLEQRPDLHWRDVRQILIDSARLCDPNDDGWERNGAGRDIHDQFGFGAVDAGAAVALAAAWTPLPHELEVSSGPVSVNAAIPDNNAAGLTRTATIAESVVVESVELVVNVESTYIGDLAIDLTSPAGTNSVLARKRTDSQRDYEQYVFTSVRQMGELSAGTWTVCIADRAAGDLATWQDFELRVQGRPRCPLDLDEDGAYGVGDLAPLLESFGLCGQAPGFEPAADINNDDCVDITDLGAFLARFGSSCE